MTLLATPWALRRQGVIGMNRRNFELVGAHNHRQAYPLVDNKLFTKRLAAKAGIPMPRLLGELSRQFEVEKISERIGELDKFVIKPAQGSGGRGILVIHGRENGHYRKSSGEVIATAEIKRLLTNIISGLYSLGGRTDSAIIESLVVASEMFDQISVGGVPDIRVIVFQGYPIMAMLRLGTLKSEGKANLHQGGIGVGIDLRTGASLGAVQYNRRVTHHPDSGVSLDDIHIPEWKSLLALACRCFDATKLGYLGCDIVIDRDAGPLLLEMNARPGLAIQLANDCGLEPRLCAVRERVAFAPSVDERVAFALDGLGGAIP
ncbi:MAG: alpha-L-glutamate ligase-like protein [Gammaproteobacteria bacterium]|nr:alpha-L-glutamate ligase-like protein [Gammaproteobacteria bacterium]MCY4276395.1 alpha-L-glutamate ligase-like protein [Gammaproteobacteria bacterium]